MIVIINKNDYAPFLLFNVYAKLRNLNFQQVIINCKSNNVHFRTLCVRL